jgi:hypothetical protein
MKSIRFALCASVLALAGCGGQEPSRDATPEEVFTQTTQAGAKSDVRVLQSRLIYEPDQTGGNFHEAFVLVRNDSDETIDVGGQVSITDKSGHLVKSFEPWVTLLPHSKGLIEEGAIDLPQPLPDGKISVDLLVESTRPGGRSSVSFSDVRYQQDDIVGCSITGIVSNRFTEVKQDLLLRVAGFSGEKLVTGGFTRGINRR